MLERMIRGSSLEEGRENVSLTVFLLYNCLKQLLKLLQDLVANFLASSLSAKIARPDAETSHVGCV